MLRMTWLNSPGRHGTGGSVASKSVTSSATYFHSVVATVSVLSIARLRSRGVFSVVPGCENSFIARTIFATRETPSSDCWMALGISCVR